MIACTIAGSAIGVAMALAIIVLVCAMVAVAFRP